MQDDALSALEAELARQDAELERTTNALATLGDVELAVPRAFLDAIEDATTIHIAAPHMPSGIRG